jgi:hypothetical protein
LFLRNASLDRQKYIALIGPSAYATVVGAKRVVWHVGFERNLRRRGPSSFEVRSEVPLSEEPLRLDYLLLRKLAPGGEPSVDHSGQTLRHLWPLLPRVSVVEYKSPVHPYRSGQLDRLWGYVHTYFANQRALPLRRGDGSLLTSADGGPEVREREDLCAVLVVAARSPSLVSDVETMGLTWEDLGSGYVRVHDGLFTLFVVELDVADPADGDDLLESFGHGTACTPEARWFWAELVGSKGMAMNVQEMEGYQELLERLLAGLPPEQRLAGLLPEQRLAGLLPEQRLAGLPPEQRLAGLPPEQRLAGLPPEQRLAGLLPEQRLAGLLPEQRLAGLPPEQRLAGLDRDHQALALPIEVLRLLPEAYFRSLSLEVVVELRRRLRDNDR